MRPSTTTKFVFLTVFGVTVALTACVNSGPRGDHGERGGHSGSSLNGPVARPVALFFAGMDKDHDMIVTREEANADIRIAWDRLSGSDVSVTSLKFATWLQQALGSADAQPSNVAFDNNFDGRISRTEFETRLFEEFELLDTSKDAALSRAELVFDLPSGPTRQNRVQMQRAGCQGGMGAPPAR